MALAKTCRCPRRRWPRCGHGWYWDARIDGRRIRRPLGTTDRREAEARAAQLEADRRSGRVRREVTGIDMASLAARARAEQDGRPESRKSWSAHVRIIRAYFGSTPVTGIDVHEVRRFLDGLAQHARTTTGRPPSPSYVRGVRATLRLAFVLAQEEGLIDVVPMPTERRRRGREGRREHLTFAQVADVVAWLRSYHPTRGPHVRVPYGDMAEVTVLTGLRIGELLALDARHVDQVRRVLVVAGTWHPGSIIGPPKTHTSKRTIRLSARAAELLARAPGAGGGRLYPVSRDACYDALHKALDALGLRVEGRAWHLFRHTHTALLDAAQIGVRSAGARLGHGSHFAQTAAYGWAAEAEDVDAIDAEWSRHG